MEKSTDAKKMRLVAKNDSFCLYERTEKKKGDWLSLKLMRRCRPKQFPKVAWWFGWNGKQLSRSRDAGLLKMYDPETYKWVVEELVLDSLM